MRKAVTEHWGFYDDSYNICDAYVLAQIAKAVWMIRQGHHTYEDYKDYQYDVLFAYVEPDKYAEKKKAEKAEEKRKKIEREAKKKAKTFA